MRGLLFLVATALTTTILVVAPAAATPPDDVSMTIVETFNPTVGTFTASGGVVGSGTTGTSSGEWFNFD